MLNGVCAGGHYHLSCNFRYTKIFVMEIFEESTVCEIYLHSIIYATKIKQCENAGMNKSTVFSREHATLPVFPLQRFRTRVETMQSFHCHHVHVVSIKTTRPSYKNCLAGYRYEKWV